MHLKQENNSSRPAVFSFWSINFLPFYNKKINNLFNFLEYFYKQMHNNYSNTVINYITILLYSNIIIN